MQENNTRRRAYAIVALLLLFGGGAHLFAQSSEHLDAIMQSEELAFGLAVYVVQLAEGAPPDADPRSIFENAPRADWGFDTKEFETPIKFGEYAYMVMESLDIDGGLLYKIFPGPRYALRELIYLRLLIGIENVNQFRTISGNEALLILNDVLNWKTARRADL